MPAPNEVWSTFAIMESFTAAGAAPLVTFAGVRPGDRVLDVAGGTGVVAITAARAGAKVTGSDLTPELVTRAKENARIARLAIDFVEADVEALPFPDASFDVVLSQYGHMFAPHPDVATAEMLRVLRPGGTIAFSTWPPELFVGRMFAIVGKYAPPRNGAPPPGLWGEPAVVRERLGDRVVDLVFDRNVLRSPYVSARHVRDTLERAIGPLAFALASLASSPEQQTRMRDELDALAEEYFDVATNVFRQDYLLSRAKKR